MHVVVFDIETANWIQGSFDPSKLKIAIVCTYSSLTDTYDSFLEDEFPRLWKLIEQADALVGYNSDHFDIPILNNYYPGDLSKIRSIDLMKEIQKSLGRRISLDTVAEATLGAKKSGSGLQSLEWWRNGEVDKVRQYCLKDVELTKRVYDHMREHGSVKYKELGKKREVAIDTSAWFEGSNASLTQTLGF